MTGYDLMNMDRALIDLDDVPTPVLRSELARALRFTAAHIARLAMIWRELEKRGEDLSDLRAGMGQYLPMIAAGHLSAEAVVRFAGNRITLNNMANLSIEDQEKIAMTGTVPVVIEQDGVRVDREIGADRLTWRLAKQVFDGPRIRTAHEQRAFMDRAASGREKKPHAKTLTVRKGRIKVGHKWFDGSELLAALAAETPNLPDAEDDAERKGVPVVLTEAEHRALRLAAARTGETMGRLIRTALWNSGLTRETV